jgi:dTMP kinase
MKVGKFISIDGVEGAGKSSQISFIVEYLTSKGIKVLETREPGGTQLGEEIRQVLLHTDTSMQAKTELLLMFAARNEHIECVIKPELARGNWVLSDRFTDASYAYQGGGRGISFKDISHLEQWVMRDFYPDLTLLLDLPIGLGLDRIANRGQKDRIEQEDVSFFERVRQAYIERAKEYPRRIKCIDASQNIEQVQAQIQALLETL